jgi:FkbM family methyltransferase
MTATGLTATELARFESAARRAEGGSIAKILADPGRMIASKLAQRRCAKAHTVEKATATTFWGEPMHVAFPEVVSLTIYRYGYFEAELVRVFAQILKPGMVFFDVGAHFGFFSMLAARLVGPAGKVHAFEPTPSTFEMLTSNLSGRPNVTLVNAAVSDKDTTLTFHDFGLGHSAFNSLYGGKLSTADRAAAQGREIRVNCRSLDSYCDETRVDPDLLKIDTEGAEPDVLRGMERLIARKRPMLTLEVGDVGHGDIRPSREVVDQVLALGYRAWELLPDRASGWSLQPHTLKSRYEYTNLLFRPV